MSESVELIRRTARQLDVPGPASLKGPAEIDGFLTFGPRSEQGWIADDDDAAEPIVRLVSPIDIFDFLLDHVSVYAGGPFLYHNKAKVTGTLSSDDKGYLLTDISTIEIWDDDQLFHLSLNDTTPTS